MKIRLYKEPPPLGRTLRYGHTGDDVKLVQTILQAEGFFFGTPLGNFKSLTLEAVKHFQGTHIDKAGDELVADGVVGTKTWWALHNPHGSAQKNHIPPPEDGEPATGTKAQRQKVLQWLYGQHAKPVAEDPDGSNYGDGVTPIVNACGFKYGIPWCLATATYAHYKATGTRPLGALHVHCSTFWNVAVDAGCAWRKGDYVPIPGDIAIYNYGHGLRKDGTLAGAGHATTVARLSTDASKHNALEGNAGNRLKHSIRAESERTLIGYVNLFGDADNPPTFKRGLHRAEEVVLELEDTR